MEHALDIFKTWAPDDALWTQWAKPVLFMCMPRVPLQSPSIPRSADLPAVDPGSALIVDLAGETGVLEGLSYARQGYRPVPLYNGVYEGNSTGMIVDVSGILAALYQGADRLAALRLKPDAPPAFLLDANRMNAWGVEPGKYDNRWCVLPQDMPSASFLLINGIRQVVVRAGGVQNDLAHILRRYEEQGLRILLDDGERTAPLKTVKPSGFRGLTYRAKVMAKLVRNATGGFGGWIPEPTQSSSGVRFYGMG